MSNNIALIQQNYKFYTGKTTNVIDGLLKYLKRRIILAVKGNNALFNNNCSWKNLDLMLS